MNINYTLIRAKRKTVGIRVTRDGEVVVRAPRSVPEAELTRIVASRAEWIGKCQKAIAEKERILSQTDEKMLDTRVRETVLPLIEKYSAEMGVAPAAVRFTDARSRFGSCSSRGTICFARRLALYPVEAVEYVVVHELAHLFEMNHSKRFYAIVEKYLPDWKARKALLSHPQEK